MASQSRPRSRPRGPRRPKLDEEQLVEQVLSGDERAAARVLGHVGPAVLRTVRGVLGREDAEVEDLVQESFVALLRALPAFRGESGLRTFATRIAAKLAMSSLRRRHRRREHDRRRPTVLDVPTDLDAAVHAEEQLQMVRTVVAALPRVQGETLLLRWVLGHSLTEVAEITGAPVNTVRSRLRLGRNAMATMLRKHPRWRELNEEDER